MTVRATCSPTVRLLAGALFFGALLGGCALKPTPLAPEDRERQMMFDMAQRFATDRNPADPVPIEQALARAIRFNLPQRVRAMETAVAGGVARVANRQMLPRLAANAGYTSQDRLTSVPGELTNSTGDLKLSWNILDFGVSYMSARQQGDRVLIARQLERKAAHTLIEEVHSTYWRVLAYDRLQTIIAPLKRRLNRALENARKAEQEKIEPPIPLLDFQVTLLETLQKLQRLERELSGARIRLAELMDVDPGHPYRLITPRGGDPLDPGKLSGIDAMERFALLNRPELWERDYQRRVKAHETRKALLRLLPGLDFSQSGNYDGTRSHANNIWAESGLSLTWSLINLLNAPETIGLARDEERLEDFRRMALNMSVVAQVHVALRRLVESRDAFQVTASLSDAKERLYHHARAAQEAQTMDELKLISREGDRIVFLTRRHIAYAELQNAAHAFLVSLGADTLPEGFQEMDLETLTAALNERSRTLPEALLRTNQVGKPGEVATRPAQPLQPVDEDTAQPAWEVEEGATPAATEQDSDLDQPAWEVEEKTPAPVPEDPNLDQPTWEIEEAAPSAALDPDLDRPEWEMMDGDAPMMARPKRRIQPIRYLLQAGYFSNPANAERMRDRLKSLGYASYHQPSASQGGGAGFVFAGPFDDIDQARRATRRVRQILRGDLMLFVRRPDGTLHPLRVHPAAADPEPVRPAPPAPGVLSVLPPGEAAHTPHLDNTLKNG